MAAKILQKKRPSSNIVLRDDWRGSEIGRSGQRRGKQRDKIGRLITVNEEEKGRKAAA